LVSFRGGRRLIGCYVGNDEYGEKKMKELVLSCCCRILDQKSDRDGSRLELNHKDFKNNLKLIFCLMV